MVRKEDHIAKKIVEVLAKAGEPLETREIEIILKNSKISRIMILYRLNDLRGQGRIKGKSVGSGKGTWIWWIDGKR